MTLTEFLLARIEEDQVKRVTMREWHAEDCEAMPHDEEGYTYPCDCGVPERMARECEAKRQIVAEWTAEDEFDRSPENWRRGIYGRDLLYLAAVYADHPDYNPEWRP